MGEGTVTLALSSGTITSGGRVKTLVSGGRKYGDIPLGKGGWKPAVAASLGDWRPLTPEDLQKVKGKSGQVYLKLRGQKYQGSQVSNSPPPQRATSGATGGGPQLSFPLRLDTAQPTPEELELQKEGEALVDDIFNEDLVSVDDTAPVEDFSREG